MGEFFLSYTTKDRREEDTNSKKDKHTDDHHDDETKSPKPGRGFRIEHCRVRNQNGKLALNGKKYSNWKDLLIDNDFVE